MNKSLPGNQLLSAGLAVCLIALVSMSCNLLKQPAIGDPPKQIDSRHASVIHDGIYTLNLPQNDIPRLAATIPLNLPKAPDGLSYQLKLMTPTNPKNGVRIDLIDPKGQIDPLFLKLDDDPEIDSSPSHVVGIGRGPLEADLKLVFRSQRPISFGQRLSLVAILDHD